MSEEQIQFLSQKKLDELKTELRRLKAEKIPALAKRIDEAKQMGDLSENAEYHAAREEMAWTLSRVKELEYIIENSEVITQNGADKAGTVWVGSTVTVKTGKITKEFTIVGPQEANPASGRISNESPLGSAFLGKKKGDKTEIKTPSGFITYEIIEVR